MHAVFRVPSQLAVLALALGAAAPARAQCHRFHEVLRDGVGGVAGLANPTDVVASGDGRHVYVADFTGDSVAVFERDAATDTLDWIDVLVDGIDGVDGLNGASAIALAPDGRHVYVAGQIDNGVAVFSRDAATGVLTFVEAVESPAVGIDHLDGASDVAVSGDGEYVYVASRTDDAIAVFARAAATGTLTFAGGPRDGQAGVDGLDGAIALVLSRDGAHLYAAGLVDDAVAVFARDAATGALGFVEVQRDGAGAVDGLAGAIAVSLAPDGSRLHVAGADDAAIAVFDRDRATGALDFAGSYADGAGGVDGLAAAGDVLASPDGLWVYGAGELDDAVAIFARNVLGVPLGFRQAAFDGVAGFDGLRGASALATSPEADRLYVTGGMESALAVLAVPALRYVGREVDGQGGVDGLGDVNAAAVSPDGRHVYAAGASDDAVAVFARDAGSGTLAFVEVEKDGVAGVDGLNGAESIAVSPDGRSVYAAGFWDDAVAAFARDAGSGALAFADVEHDGVGGADALGQASSIAVSPDGAHVYATAYADDGVQVFSRSAATSALVAVGAATNGVGGVVALDGPRSVAVSPDGRHVYVASQLGDAIGVFDRDAATGLLAFVEAEIDGAGGADGLHGVSSVAVSPDGAQVWAAGTLEDAVAVFDRDPANGRLAFDRVWRDGIDGVNGLDGIAFVAVAGGGARVYGVGGNDQAIAVFGRDPASGTTRFRDAVLEECGAAGMGGAVRVAVSPDTRHVYLAGAFENSLAVFAPEPGAGSLAAAAWITLAAAARGASRRRAS